MAARLEPAARVCAPARRRPWHSASVVACRAFATSGRRRAAAFYEEHARARRYFYHVDLLGRLFSEETEVRNIATCVKGEKLLDFFFKNVQPNRTGVLESEYAHISFCGKEVNYLHAADTPVVFTDLAQDGADAWLRFGGTLQEPFDPAQLAVSETTGRLYHPLTAHRKLSLAGQPPPRMLLRSALVSELEGSILSVDEAAAPPPSGARTHASWPPRSGVAFQWHGELYPIELVP